MAMMKLREGFVFVVRGRRSKVTMVDDKDPEYKTQKWKFEPMRSSPTAPPEEEAPPETPPVDLAGLTEKSLEEKSLDELRAIYLQVFDAAAPSRSKKSELVPTIWEAIVTAKAKA